MAAMQSPASPKRDVGYDMFLPHRIEMCHIVVGRTLTEQIMLDICPVTGFARQSVRRVRCSLA